VAKDAEDRSTMLSWARVCVSRDEIRTPSVRLPSDV
jgi:hypothetical protein